MNDEQELRRAAFLESLKSTIANLAVEAAQLRADLAVANSMVKKQRLEIESQAAVISALMGQREELQTEVEALQAPSQSTR